MPGPVYLRHCRVAWRQKDGARWIDRDTVPGEASRKDRIGHAFEWDNDARQRRQKGKRPLTSVHASHDSSQRAFQSW